MGRYRSKCVQHVLKRCPKFKKKFDDSRCIGRIIKLFVWRPIKNLIIPVNASSIETANSSLDGDKGGLVNVNGIYKIKIKKLLKIGFLKFLENNFSRNSREKRMQSNKLTYIVISRTRRNDLVTGVV